MSSIQSDYLEKMGIQQWLPRRALLAASPSPDWVYRFTHPQELLDDDSLASALTPETHKVAEPHAERRAIAHISETLAGVDEPVVKSSEIPLDEPPASLSEAPKSSSSSAVQTPPRYKIIMARAGRLLLVDDLPLRSRGGFTDHHKRLLAGITLALGEDPATLTLPITLEWPMLAGRTLDQGPTEARRYVKRQLEILQKEPGIETIVMFGERLATWIVGEDHPNETGKLQFIEGSSINYLVTQSLTQVLNQPGTKRQVWVDIQPLLNSL